MEKEECMRDIRFIPSNDYDDYAKVIINEFGCFWCCGIGVNPHGICCGECNNITLKECEARKDQDLMNIKTSDWLTHNVPEDRLKFEKYSCSIGAMLYLERNKRKMTVREFAKLLQVSKHRVKRWESYCYNFSLKELGYIFSKLDLQFHFEISGKEQ